MMPTSWSIKRNSWNQNQYKDLDLATGINFLQDRDEISICTGLQDRDEISNFFRKTRTMQFQSVNGNASSLLKLSNLDLDSKVAVILKFVIWGRPWINIIESLECRFVWVALMTSLSAWPTLECPRLLWKKFICLYSWDSWVFVQNVDMWNLYIDDCWKPCCILWRVTFWKTHTGLKNLYTVYILNKQLYLTLNIWSILFWNRTGPNIGLDIYPLCC